MTDQKNFDWKNVYKNIKITEMPWYNPNLDDDLQNALDKLGLKSGTFLDIGTGPATQANKLEEKGFEVTGTDISKEAILLAKQAYKKIEFIQDDILNTNLTKKERERIGDLVKALRNNSGISQKDLAFKVGVSPARISQIEKGTLDYRVDTLIVILDHFDRKIHFI